MGFILALFAVVAFASGLISIYKFITSQPHTITYNRSMLGIICAAILLAAFLLAYFSSNTSTSGLGKSVNLTTAAPTAIPTPTATPFPTPKPTPSPTPSPAPSPTPTPTPAFTLKVPSRFAGTYYQADGSSYEVRLEIAKQNADGSFDGKWYVTVNGSEEDLIVTGVIAPFSQSGQLSQIDQTELQPVQQINHQDRGNDLLLWFASTRRDRGQDILLGYVYYGAIEQGGSVQGVSYLAGSSESAATFQLDSKN